MPRSRFLGAAAFRQLRDAIAGKKPGDQLKLEVFRGNDKQRIEVKLGQRPPLPG